MNAREKAIRQKLGIPESATKVLIFEASAHLDWDWVNTFLGYYNDGYGGYEPVKETFKKAIEFMQNNQNQPENYYYAICEMAYLRQYLKENPDQINVLKGLKDQLAISGGGITSAENLLPHGEAFIRNYLIGQKWLSDTLGFTSVRQLWIPDDFGSDAQLPIVTKAMGFEGVGFWRAPIAGKFNGATTTAQTPSQILTNNGLDFLWQADDNSGIYGHWLNIGYCGGNNLLGYGQTSLYWSASLQDSITNSFVDSANLSPTPYSFIPIDCDFNTPYDNLLEIISNWNACNGWDENGNGCPGQPIPSSLEGAYIVAATFIDHMELVKLNATETNPSPLSIIRLFPNPYYSACYATHPDLKQMHYAATRTLLQAESMEIFLEYLAVKDTDTWTSIVDTARTKLGNSWNDLMPSTHHDYITGTSPDNIYKKEQQPDLQTALESAQTTRSYILNNIVAAIPPLDTTGKSIVLFNGTGVPQGGPVELLPPEGDWKSVLYEGSKWPIQPTNNGQLLFTTGEEMVSPFGYNTILLSEDQPDMMLELESSHNKKANTYTLTNQFIEVEIGVHGLISMKDLQNHGAELLSAPGNLVTFYEDGGNIYRFGNEIPYTEAYDTCVAFQKQSFELQNPSIELLIDKSGPVRKSVQVSGYYIVNQKHVDFIITYSLVAGEEWLRISTTGTAPSGYSVMVSFSLTEPTEKLTHGTAYHWQTASPRQYWTTEHDCSAVQEQMTFEATHGFVIPVDGSGNQQAALYHESTPAWAIANGSILGCILRNVPNPQYNAATGSDNAQHTANYALRVPSSLQPPTAGGKCGGPLREALQFNNPLLAIVLPEQSQGNLHLPNSMSIASTPDQQAVITALKGGTWIDSNIIARIYQPTNGSNDVTMNIDSSIAELYQDKGKMQADEITALELVKDDSLPIETGAETISFIAPYALTTIELRMEE